MYVPFSYVMTGSKAPIAHGAVQSSTRSRRLHRRPKLSCSQTTRYPAPSPHRPGVLLIPVACCLCILPLQARGTAKLNFQQLRDSTNSTPALSQNGASRSCWLFHPQLPSGCWSFDRPEREGYGSSSQGFPGSYVLLQPSSGRSVITMVSSRILIPASPGPCPSSARDPRRQR